jgi:Tol biopolymer transport system component
MNGNSLRFCALAAVFLLCITFAPQADQGDPESAVLTHVTQLTDGFERAGEAYFSPDMKWIVFQATTKSQPHYQMYLAKLKWQDGLIVGIEEPLRLSPEPSRNTCGHFSPDAKTLIFASTAGKDDPNEPEAGFQREGRDYRWAYPKGMEIYRLPNWQQAVENTDPNGPLDLGMRALTDNDAYDAECSFSPDGKWIVFTSNREGHPPRTAEPQPDPAILNKDLELYAMRADGSGVVRLTYAPGYDGGPFFSPDGRRIVYRSDRHNNNLLQVFVADLVFDSAGNIAGIANEKQLTNDVNVNWGPYWHPDGTHLVYATSAHGHTNYEIYLMRDDGSKKTRLTYAAGADVLPVFSPDGKWLIWASKRNGKHTQIYAARFTLPPGS